jgi:hypothetical protein
MFGLIGYGRGAIAPLCPNNSYQLSINNLTNLLIWGGHFARPAIYQQHRSTERLKLKSSNLMSFTLLNLRLEIVKPCNKRYGLVSIYSLHQY